MLFKENTCEDTLEDRWRNSKKNLIKDYMCNPYMNFK